MNAIKTARKFIESEPTDPDAAVLSDLALALEAETVFDLSRLYEMNLEHFELAMEVMRDWRLDRYYEGKAKLLAISMRLREIEGEGQSESDEAAPGH